MKAAFRQTASLFAERRGKRWEGEGRRFPVYFLAVDDGRGERLWEQVFFRLAETIASLLMESPLASGSTPFFSVLLYRYSADEILEFPLSELDTGLVPAPVFKFRRHSKYDSRWFMENPLLWRAAKMAKADTRSRRRDHRPLAFIANFHDHGGYNIESESVFWRFPWGAAGAWSLRTIWGAESLKNMVGSENFVYSGGDFRGLVGRLVERVLRSGASHP
jgi:hypothetical protein